MPDAKDDTHPLPCHNRQRLLHTGRTQRAGEDRGEGLTRLQKRPRPRGGTTTWCSGRNVLHEDVLKSEQISVGLLVNNDI
jgi:hypothetical protein